MLEIIHTEYFLERGHKFLKARVQHRQFFKLFKYFFHVALHVGWHIERQPFKLIYQFVHLLGVFPLPNFLFVGQLVQEFNVKEMTRTDWYISENTLSCLNQQAIERRDQL
jgi:hypothetical protein